MQAYLNRSLLAPAAAASGRQCPLGVRPTPTRSRQVLCAKGQSRDSEPAAEATDEELLHQLNSGHLWLPEESDDFGLDDVAAHVANRNQAQRLDLAAASRAAVGKARRRAGKGRQQQPAPSTLNEIDPASGKLPGWVAELQGAGFDVLGRNGELFLQRGAVPQQPSSSSSSSSTAGAGSRARQQQQQQTASRQPQQAAAGSQPAVQQPTAGGVAVSDRSLAVRSEFDPLVWQQQSSSSSSSSSSAAGTETDAGSWYAQPAGSSSTSSSGSSAPAVAGGRNTSSSSSSSSSVGLGQAGSAAARAKACREVQKRLLGFRQPEQLLAYVESCFPDWAANGCWLLHQQRAGVVAAPTPAEAAAALKGVALAAKRAGFRTVQMQGLARDRRVLGLVECLRLAAPRSPPHQDPAITQRLWSIAKAYWLQAGAAATAAQQQLLAAAREAAASGQAPPGALNGAAVPQLGPLLAGLQAAGLRLSREQLAAAQSLISARQEDAVRQQAWVAALWGLAAIGGPLFFQAEVDALAQVAALSRWQLSSFELSDVLWALASSRHWCPLLGQLEASLMAAGGPAACSAPELLTALWAFATLSHQPKQLLAELDAKGWCVRPSSELPAAQRSSSQQSRPAKPGKRQQQQQQQQQQAGSDSSSSVCRLSELSGSQLSTLVWSLACLQQVDGVLFRQAWVEVCRRGPGLGADVVTLVRLAQAALAVQLEASYSPTELYCDEGTRQLLDAAAKTFKQQSGALQSKAHSTYQRGIASTLTKMRVMHVLEDNTTGYAVDITLPGLRIAIEADGPSHMSRTRAGKAGRVMLGATAMKRRHLQGLGWAVLNVAYSDWDALQGEEQRTAFLKRKLAAAVKAGS